MAVMKTATILPTTRRYAPMVYLTPPRVWYPPLNVRDYFSGTAPPATTDYTIEGRITNPTTPALAAIPNPTKCLAFWGAIPKILLPLPVPRRALLRYYVYHPTATKIGPFVVKTESGLRVVYMTSAQAVQYISCKWIGKIPWHLVAYGSRKLIYMMSGHLIIADLPPVVNTPLVDQTGNVSVPDTYQFAADSFWDPDNHSAPLTYTATLSSGAALPVWCVFTAATRTFAGTPTSATTYTIRVRATDQWGRYVTDDFNWVISA